MTRIDPLQPTEFQLLTQQFVLDQQQRARAEEYQIEQQSLAFKQQQIRTELAQRAPQPSPTHPNLGVNIDVIV